MAYRRGSSLVVQREYSYDTLGRPTARNTARQGAVVNDVFAHNSRSELSSARVNGVSYGYAYDSIGNRAAAVEDSSGVASRTEYTVNELNQYTRITENAESVFIPEFDADGNQTRIKTETGIWGAVYNSENRPVTFSNADSGIVVESAYDSMGRRTYKRVTLNGNVTLHQRYIYRGYLQIACIDLTRSHHPGLWLITWDPTQPIATRPMAIQKDGTWYTYGLDLTKNVCEVFGTTGYIRTAYTYTPYGSVTATGSTTQPIQWSSEFYDSELGLVYYNYRHYNPVDGRWISKDYILESQLYMLYSYISNTPIAFSDFIGLWLGRRHISLTKSALEKFPFLLTDRRYRYKITITDEIISMIATGNTNTDDKPLRYNQAYHFCATHDSKVEEFTDAYKTTLTKEKQKFYNLLSEIKRGQPDEIIKNKCDEALSLLGRLTHMWQDYYGHGRQSVEELGIISGSPDDIQATPSSFSANGFKGNHTEFTFGHVEPGERAIDKENRVNSAIDFTRKASTPLLKDWFKLCTCQYYRSALEAAGYCCKS